MSFWDKIQKDVQKGMTEGWDAFTKMTHELSEEGKKKYSVYSMKTGVHREFYRLGGLVYELNKAGADPMKNALVKSTLQTIKKLEADISKVETGKPASAKKKSAPKKAGAKKKSASKGNPEDAFKP